MRLLAHGVCACKRNPQTGRFRCASTGRVKPHAQAMWVDGEPPRALRGGSPPSTIVHRQRRPVARLPLEWSAEARACEEGLATQLLLDPEQLVVLSQALAAARSPCLDLACAEPDDEVRDEGVLRLAGAVGDHDTPAAAHGHGGRIDGLGDGADLVHLQEQRVACADIERLGDALRVRNKQVVADNLDLLAHGLHQMGVAVPIILVEGVFDGDHGVLLGPLLVELAELRAGLPSGGVRGGVLEVQVILAILVELGGGNVGADLHLVCVSRLLQGLHEHVQSLVVVLHGRRKATLVAHIAGVLAVLLLDAGLQVVVHLGAHDHGLHEARGADRQDHELLAGEAVARVAPAVDDVHRGHRHDELVDGLAAELGDVLVQRHLAGGGACAADCHGDRQDGIGTELGLAPAPLVLGAVELLDHLLVDARLVRDVHAHELGGDDVVDVGHGLEHALAEKPALVVVAQLKGLVDPRRGARGHRRAEERRLRAEVDLHGRVATGIENLARTDLDDLRHHGRKLEQAQG
mmetsp:Transcript_124212/g.322656  ORF Transcript_124212/g.322656 Transcript_124212/m.322656 type:complete len:520 (+) Transcript_124212:44-1603(+)